MHRHQGIARAGDTLRLHLWGAGAVTIGAAHVHGFGQSVGDDDALCAQPDQRARGGFGFQRLGPAEQIGLFAVDIERTTPGA